MPAVDEHLGSITTPDIKPLKDVWKGFTHFAEGDVIFAKITPSMENGKTAVARGLINGLACGSTEFHVLRPTEALNADYIWRYLRQKSFRAEAEAAMTGVVAQRRVPRPFLEEHELPIPPLLEQRRIVAKLDRLSVRTAAAPDHLARITKLAARAKQSILAETLSDEWPLVQLYELAKVGTGTTPKKGNSRFYDKGSIPWVTSGAVNDSRILAADQFITEAAIPETNCKVYPTGTLLMAMYGEGRRRGMVARLEIDAATNQALAAIQINQDAPVRDDCVKWLLHSKYLELRKLAPGGVQPNLNLGMVKAIKVPIPPLEEQDIRIKRIGTAFARIDRLTQEASRAVHLLDRVDERLLATAFRGEFVPQNPEDEPAEALLTRIREARATAPKQKRGRRKETA